MKKYIEVGSCRACPFIGSFVFQTQGDRACKRAKRSINDKMKIPTWCPLPDLPAEPATAEEDADE